MADLKKMAEEISKLTLLEAVELKNILKKACLQSEQKDKLC